jgi:hypothetical protein
LVLAVIVARYAPRARRCPCASARAVVTKVLPARTCWVCDAVVDPWVNVTVIVTDERTVTSRGKDPPPTRTAEIRLTDSAGTTLSVPAWYVNA